MANKSFKLTIDKPCSQSWNAMSVTDGGRYCTSCSKTVVDFSKMDNEEIADYFKTIYAAANESGQEIHVCGHLRKSQLVTTYTFSYKTPLKFNSTFVRLSLAGILTFSSLKSFAQTTEKGKIKIVQDDSGKNKKNNATQLTSTAKQKPVKFQVKITNETTKKAVTNAMIQIEGVSAKFKTNNTGYATINLPDSLSEKIINMNISSPGLETQFIQVDLKTQNSTLIKVLMYYFEVEVNGGMGFVPVTNEPKKII
ncbi:MAG: hypothetical protein IAF38_16550 [Bacteroidia bacterium]|nr:hypothetical protein [Bacteroidia bacterium]